MIDLLFAVLVGLAGVLGLAWFVGGRWLMVVHYATRLAEVHKLYDPRERYQAKMRSETVRGGGETPQRGVVIPWGWEQSAAGPRIPRRLTVYTRIGVDTERLATYRQDLNHYSDEVWTLRQVPGTRRVELALAPKLPLEPPAYPTGRPHADQPTLIPVGMGRLGPMVWDVDDFAPQTGDPLILRGNSMLVVAQTGFGKTYLLLGAVLHHVERASDYWTVRILDPEASHPDAAVTLAERVEVLREVVADMDDMTVKQKEGTDYQAQIAERGRTLVVIDEFPTLMAKVLASDPQKDLKLEGQRLVNTILEQGRKRGKHMLAMGTKARIEEIGPARDSFGVRVAGWLDRNGYQLLFNETPPHKQPKRTGLGWVTTVEGLAEMQLYERPTEPQPQPLQLGGSS